MLRLTALFSVALLNLSAVVALAQRVEFINLTVPADRWTDREATWVLKATANSCIIAQGGVWDYQDVSVVKVDGQDWSFVGQNGNRITGVRGSIVHAVATSPDGRLWLMAEHSRFPNGTDGNPFCLYVLEDDQWQPVGPRFGIKKSQDQFSGADDGLHFAGDNRPISLRIEADPQHETWRASLRRLEGDTWLALPEHSYVVDRSHNLHFAWQSSDMWLLQVSRIRSQTVLDVRRITGPLPGTVEKTWRLDSWPYRVSDLHFEVSADGLMAVGARCVDEAREETHEVIRIYTRVGTDNVQVDEVPARPRDPDDALKALGWGDGRTLYVVGLSSMRLAVDRYADRHWTRVASVSQPEGSEAQITRPRLFFRDDRLPIVTWEKFAQVD